MAKWRVKPGKSHYLLSEGKLVLKEAGEKIELAPHKATPFLDKLEPADKEAREFVAGTPEQEDSEAESLAD